MVKLLTREIGRHVEFRMYVGPDREHLQTCHPEYPGACLRMTRGEFEQYRHGLAMGIGGSNVTVEQDMVPETRWVALGSDGQQSPRAEPGDSGYEPDFEVLSGPPITEVPGPRHNDGEPR